MWSESSEISLELNSYYASALGTKYLTPYTAYFDPDALGITPILGP